MKYTKVLNFPIMPVAAGQTLGNAGLYSQETGTGFRNAQTGIGIRIAGRVGSPSEAGHAWREWDPQGHPSFKISMMWMACSTSLVDLGHPFCLPPPTSATHHLWDIRILSVTLASLTKKYKHESFLHTIPTVSWIKLWTASVISCGMDTEKHAANFGKMHLLGRI